MSAALAADTPTRGGHAKAGRPGAKSERGARANLQTVRSYGGQAKPFFTRATTGTFASPQVSGPSMLCITVRDDFRWRPRAACLSLTDARELAS